jgi:hypothetical protein
MRRNSLVSIIACTKRPDFIPAILTNYDRQNIEDKELILVINYDAASLPCLPTEKRIQILHFSSHDSLGACLNKAMKFANFNIIAKFDDDDYYGAQYLSEAVEVLKNTKAHIVGKACFYVYFQEAGYLSILRPLKENQFITEPLLAGSTLVFCKEVLDKVHFPNCSIGEDLIFLKECLQKGLILYSSSRRNYSYIRYSDFHHTSDVTNARLKKCFPSIIQTEDYSIYVDEGRVEHDE